MKVRHSFFVLSLFVLLFYSCDKNDCRNLNGNYSSGVFVVNEGLFGGTGTITWHNPATGETVQNVYEKENCGASLGQFVQSLTIHNGKGYIVVNGDNKIVVVDAATFQYQGIIEGLELPRFFQPISDRFAYVSQWGADGISGSLAKVDLQTNTVIKTIPVGSGPEKMVRTDQRLIVANSGGFGVDSTLVEIDLSNDSIVQIYTASGKNPASIVLENQQVANALYLCKGYYLDAMPSGNLNQMTGGPTNGLSVPAYSDDLVRDESGLLFFTANTAIYQISAIGGQYTVAPLFDQNAYGLGLDAEKNLLYCADAKDFNSAGEVVIRNFDGSMVGSFPVGIGPGEIIIY